MDNKIVRETEEQLQLHAHVLASMSEGVSVADEHGIIIYTNAAQDAMFGYAPGELVGQHVSVQNDHPADENRRIVAGVIDQLMRTGVWTGEWRNRRKDGSTFHTHTNITRLSFGGRPHFVCVQRDISQQRALDAALRASEQRYRGLFSSIDDGFCVVEILLDAEGRPSDYRFVEANGAFASHTGLTDAIGRTALELVPGLERWWIETYGRVALNGQPARFENRSVPMGRWFDVHAFRIGEPAARQVAIFFKDITARKIAHSRDRLLLALDDALRPLGDPDQLTLTAARLLGELLGVDRCAYADVEPDQDAMNLTGNYTRGPEIRSIVGRLRFSDFGPEVLRLMRADKAYIVNDVDTHNPPVKDKSAYRAAQIQAVICVPLCKGGRFAAAMAVHMATPRAWQPDEVELVRAVAARCWESIERSRVARELRESETRFRLVFESDAAALSIWHADGRILDANEAYLRLTRRTRDELLRGEVRWDALTPDDQRHLDERAIAQMTAGQPVTPYEKEYQLGDGRRVPVLIGGAMFPGTGNTGVGFAVDLSEQKQAQAALLENEEQLRLFVEHAPAALAMLDTSMRYLRVSRRWMQDLRLGDQNIIGRSHYDVFPEVPEAWREFHRRALAGEVLTAEEDRFGRADGSVQWIRWELRPWRRGSGQVGGIVIFTEDVTAKKEAAVALRESEAQLRTLAEAVPCIVWIAAPDGALTYLNSRWEELTGWRVGDSLGFRWAELMHPDDQPGILEQWQRATANGSTYEGEVRYRRHDGQYRWHLFRGLPLKDPEGRIVRWYGTSLDVHDLREAEQRFRRMADTAPAILWVTEADGSCSFLSRGWYDYTGQTAAEALGFGWLTATHPDDARRSEAAFRKANERHEPFAIEYRVRRADGTYRWTIDAGRPRFDGDGTFLGYVGSVFEVHEMIEAREALREQRRAADQLGERLTLALQSARAGWFDWDAPTNTNIWSDELQRLYGFAPGEFGGTSDDWLGALVPEDRVAGSAAISRSLETGEFVHEFRIRRQDTGEVRWMDGRGKVFFDVDSKPLRMVGINVDITERKAAEAERDRLLSSERAARAEAEHASRLKDEFLTTLSHELRTPLNAIAGWAQLMRGGRLSDEDIQQAVDVINRNAYAQKQLIEDLLDMSRIISGKVRLDVQRVELAEVVSAAIESVQPTADTKGVRLERVLDPLAGPVSGDPNRLQQVIWNLLTNAIKFTPKGGKVLVTLERVNSHLEIAVSDTGIGIRPEFLPHVFDRFRQADASTTRQHGGLGLGLSIVKQLVEMHNGQVRAKSPGEGKGATFVVSLALAPVITEVGERTHPKAEPGGETGAFELPDLRGILVLVVDDDPDSRGLMKRVLEQPGASVITAGSAADGLAAVKRERPTVIVSDIGMPGEDGYAFIRQIRALDDELGKIPAVAVTALARSEDRRQAVRAGYQSHIAKPMDAGELIEIVASFAGRTSGRR